MLAFIAILFILAITFFIGQRTGKSVPDEVVPARRYLVFGIDVLLIIMLAYALFSYGQLWLALLSVLLIFARKYLLLSYASVSGIVIAAASLLAIDAQLIILTLCLVGNFLLGAVEQTRVKQNALIQPIVALALFVILQAL